MTDPYPNPPSYYDDLITDVIKPDHSDVNSVQRAVDAWQTFGTLIQGLVPPPGATGNGYASNDPVAPQLSLSELVSKHLSGWTGNAAQEFLTQAGLVGTFGYLVGLTMYDAGGENPPDDHPPSSTFHIAVSGLYDALSLITQDYPQIKSAHQQWTSTLAKNLINVTNGADPAQNLPAWAPTTVTVYPDENVMLGKEGYLYVTVNDGTESQSTQLPGASVIDYSSGYPSGYWVDSSKITQNQIQQWLAGNFTKLYKQRVGLYADMITSEVGGYVQSAQLLPAKIDESKLPPGSSNNQGSGDGQGSGGGIPLFGGSSSAGGGALTAPGGLHGLGSAGGGALTAPGGLHGLGSSGGGNLTGTGAGGGNVPTHLAGFGGGGAPGLGVGPGGVPLGGGAGGAGLGPGALGKLGGVGGVGGGLGGLGGVGGGGIGGGIGGPGGLGSAFGAGGGLGPGVVGAGGPAGEPMPMMPPMFPPGMAGNADNSRQRKSWLPEGDDFWGADDAAVPPVISHEP